MPALEQVVASCPREAAAALLGLGNAHLARGDRAAAAAAFDRLDREHPASPQATEARARLVALAGQLPARSAAERARLLLERGNALLVRGAHGRRDRGAAGGAAREPRRGRGRPRPGAAGPGPPREGPRRGGPRAPPAGASRLPPRRRGRLPARARPGAALAQRRSLRGGGRPLPGDAVGRGGAPLPREPLPEGRPRRRGAALVAATRRRVPAGPLRGEGGVARGLGRLSRPPLRGRRAAVRDDGAAAPAERLDRRVPLLVRAAPGWPWARPTAPGRSSRRRSSATSTPTTAFARARSSPGSVAAPRRRPCSWPRRLPRRRRSPSRARAALRQLLLLDRLDRGGGGAAPAARVPARAGDARLGRTGGRGATARPSPR